MHGGRVNLARQVKKKLEHPFTEARPMYRAGQVDPCAPTHLA